MNGETVIKTTGLSREYKSYTKSKGVRASLRGFWRREHEIKHALRPTDLEIFRGQTVGLVGSNGAGKTTLLKLLSGLIHPSTGNASVLGYSPSQRDPAFLKRISILLGQKAQLWWDLSPADSFDLLTRIYELDPVVGERRVQELAERLQCTKQLTTQLRRLSLGERMKMEIIGALLHQPEVLFLDEPTIGLDVNAQKIIRDFFKEFKQNERATIILTSHYMDDISFLADRLLLIRHGELVYDGTVEAFTSKAEQKNRLAVKTRDRLPRGFGFGPLTALSEATDLIEVDLAPAEMAPLIQAIASVAEIEDLKITKTDFEDVISEFLAKDVRAGQARPSFPT